jgi:hypothetical protein
VVLHWEVGIRFWPKEKKAGDAGGPAIKAGFSGFCKK